MKSRLTDEQKKYILDNYRKITNVQIAKNIYCTPQQVSYYAKTQGLKNNSKHLLNCAEFSDEDNEYMKLHYKDMKYSEIAKVLGYTERQIRGRINNMGLKKNREFNSDYFNIIDTSLKAYFLGFIYADGWICCNEDTKNYEFGMELQSKDRYILDKLNEELNGDHKIYHKDAQETIICGNLCHSTPSDTLRVYSKELVFDLINNGIETNKTEKVIYPVVNDNLFFDFLRGYIDGDGCFYFDREYLMMHITCCTNTPLLYLQKKLSDYNINSYIYKETDRKYRLYVVDRNSINSLVNNLYYNEDVFCLKRKLEKINKYKCLASQK